MKRATHPIGPVAALLAASLIAGCAGSNPGGPQSVAPGTGTNTSPAASAPFGSSPAVSSPAPSSPALSSPVPTSPGPSSSGTGSPGTGSPGTGSPATGGAGPAPGVAQPLRSDLPRQAAGNPAAAGSALDALGSALLQQLPAGDNSVLSPYSIYAVLAMAGAGAKGVTAAQLDAALGGAASAQSGDLTAIDKAVAAALAAGKPVVPSGSASTDAPPAERVDVANSVWLSPALPVRQSYLDTLATGFGVGMYKIDYAAAPEAARRAINAWVGQHTDQLIPELIGKGVVTAETVMTLVNAMYLSAPWQKEFVKSVAPLPFTTAAGTKTTAPAITVTDSFVTSTGKGWTSVTIPYRGGGLAMTLVIPDSGSFAAVGSELPTVLATATQAKSMEPVTLSMPTFKSQAHLSLVPAMRALGVTDIFSTSADLSGIAGNPGQLYASNLVHQAVISVDEKGTEAAAATAMTMVPTSAMGGEVKDITVDRPFFYSVHDTTTGAPLFLGQITDPTR